MNTRLLLPAVVFLVSVCAPVWALDVSLDDLEDTIQDAPKEQAVPGEKPEKKANGRYVDQGPWLYPIEESRDNFIYVDDSGSKVLGPFNYAYPWSEGYGLVETKEGNYQLIDKTGKETLELPEGAWFAGGFSSGLVPIAWDRNDQGFMNHKGEVVIKGLMKAFPFQGDFAEVASKRGDKQVISRAGKVLQAKAPQFRKYALDIPMAAFKSSANGSYYFMRDDGRQPFNNKMFEEVGNFNEGVCPVMTGKNKKTGQREWALFTIEGKVVPKKKRYMRMGNMHHGRAPVMIASKWGAIDEKGKLKIKCTYSSLGEFHEGLAPFYDEAAGAYGYINTKNKVVIKPQFGNAMPFKHGVAEVEHEGVPSLVNTKGDIIWPKQ